MKPKRNEAAWRLVCPHCDSRNTRTAAATNATRSHHHHAAFKMTRMCPFRRTSSPTNWNRGMSARDLACVVVLAGALAGCAVGPDYLTPDTAIPANFTAAPAGKELGSSSASADLWQWWRTLRDPQLNRLIDRAIENNLDLKIALDRLQQARLQLVVIGAQ